MRLLLGLALVLCGCRETADSDALADPSDTDAVSESGTDARVDVYRDPYCHWDCFGHSACGGGTVTVWRHTPVPCEYWTGSCPIEETFTCVKGCRTDGVSTLASPFTDPHELCEEGRPKKAGDPCAGEADCLPTPAVVGDAGVTTKYLLCDAEAGRCDESPPPVVTDWLAPCPASASGLGAGAYGYVGAPECSMGVCLVYNDTARCLLQGCSKPCVGDHECPPGSVCQSGLPNQGKPVGDAGYVPAVCKPGPWNIIGIDLKCAPPSDAGADG